MLCILSLPLVGTVVLEQSVETHTLLFGATASDLSAPRSGPQLKYRGSWTLGLGLMVRTGCVYSGMLLCLASNRLIPDPFWIRDPLLYSGVLGDALSSMLDADRVPNSRYELPSLQESLTLFLPYDPGMQISANLLSILRRTVISLAELAYACRAQNAAIISSSLMCFELSSLDHTPPVPEPSHEVPQPVNYGTKLELPDLPSHSQSVERAVKLTSETSHTVYGLESRHTHILAKALSRQMRPSFASKGSYSEHYDDLGI